MVPRSRMVGDCVVPCRGCCCCCLVLLAFPLDCSVFCRACLVGRGGSSNWRFLGFLSSVPVASPVLVWPLLAAATAAAESWLLGLRDRVVTIMTCVFGTLEYSRPLASGAQGCVAMASGRNYTGEVPSSHGRTRPAPLPSRLSASPLYHTCLCALPNPSHELDRTHAALAAFGCRVLMHPCGGRFPRAAEPDPHWAPQYASIHPGQGGSSTPVKHLHDFLQAVTGMLGFF